ncbi:MAG: ribosome small subunit-dependent GTPase A [Nitrospinota bacterium]|nr:ribosome small subunit-dependent GTPase A [Nitrospinota bacterium]
MTESEQRFLKLPGKWLAKPPAEQPIIGDWILLDSDGVPYLLLERSTLLERNAPGTGGGRQLMAANVDTLFIVSGLDRDFNLSRIERYLALAVENGVRPVVVLTKADLNPDHEKLCREVERLYENVVAVALDARDSDTASSTLMPWIGPGETVAFMGSSGVGKSTLINSLLSQRMQETKEISQVDERGVHTTTERAMFPLAGGGWLLDTPGMRQLRLSESGDGLAEVFNDIEELAHKCRFGDCRHQGEPACAVEAAVESGELDKRRLTNYQKLQREQSILKEKIHERHKRERKFGRMVKDAERIRKNR